MQLPFILAMLFLSTDKATVDFGNFMMQIGKTTLQGMEQQPPCKLHAIAMQTAKAYEQLGCKDVFSCLIKWYSW